MRRSRRCKRSAPRSVASHRGELNHLVRFELDRSRLAEAAALADVAWIEPSATYSFNNDKAQWVVQSGVPNSRPVFDRGIRGQGQVVMISDSGLRTNHDMFYDSTQAITSWGDYPTQSQGHRVQAGLQLTAHLVRRRRRLRLPRHAHLRHDRRQSGPLLERAVVGDGEGREAVTSWTSAASAAARCDCPTT